MKRAGGAIDLAKYGVDTLTQELNGDVKYSAKETDSEGYAQITILVTTLMMVGVITLPMEIKYSGRKQALKRNALALVFSVLLSLVMGRLIA